MNRSVQQEQRDTEGGRTNNKLEAVQQVDERHHLRTRHHHPKYGVRRVQGGGKGRLPGRMYSLWFID